MRKNNLYKFALILFSIVVILPSCLKDEMYDEGKYGLKDLNVNQIIEIPSNASHTKSLALLPQGLKDVTIGEVRLAAEEPAKEDIVVNLSTSKTVQLLKDVNLFPFAQMQLPATVTIPKGQQSMPLIAKINTDYLQGGSQYIAVSIISVNNSGYVVSGNFGDLILNLKVKSLYEGKYKYEATSNLGANNGTVDLITVTPTKVQLKQGLINKYSNEVFYIIDPVTNKVTVECPSLGATTESGSYDPATKSFTVKWNGRGGKYTFDEKFTRIN